MKQICLLILILSVFSSCSIEKNNPFIYKTGGPLRAAYPQPADTDQDGVQDKTDKEKKSPLYAAVDLKGISIDSDNDGCIDSEDPEPVSDLKKQMKGCENVILSLDSIKKYVEICRIGNYGNSSPGDWYLPMIFFEQNSSVIKKDNELELNFIIEIMKKYTSMNLIISGHRIDIGNNSEMPSISEERSRSAIEYLIMHGISIDRLSINHTYLSEISFHYEMDFMQFRRVDFHIILN